MISFGEYSLLALDLLFAQDGPEEPQADSFCPPGEHQHVMLTWKAEGKPMLTVHAVGNPSDGSDWTIHTDHTDEINQQHALGFAMQTLQDAGVDAQFVEGAPPGMMPQPNDQNTTDEPGGLYL